ncbi:MAG: hypothetical protein IBX63_02190 [Coriobacteriia bacterium]|nr:hypothetical protein [Coriobacteriia bacterium]
MQDREYAQTFARVRRALAGEPGEPCTGITFLAEDAIRALAWGSSADSPLVTAVCSRLAPDFAFVESWIGDASATCQSVAGCGTVPFWVVRGPLDAVANARSWSESLAATVRDAAALAPLLDGGVEAACMSVRVAAACGAGAIVVADDLAGADGPLMAPDFALSELLPRLGVIAATAVGEDLPAIWHSDGDTRAFLGAAARGGFAGVHPGGLGPDPFRRLFGRARQEGMVVLGGLPGWALRAGVPSALRAATSASVIARSGGLLVCDDGGVSTGEEIGALIAALQTVRGPT